MATRPDVTGEREEAAEFRGFHPKGRPRDGDGRRGSQPPGWWTRWAEVLPVTTARSAQPWPSQTWTR